MLAAILITCMLVLRGPTHQPDHLNLGESDPPQLGRLILSTKVQERKETYKYAMTAVIGLRRQKSRLFLLRVIQANPLIPPNSGSPHNEEDQYAPRRIALSILAEWHDPELIRIFIENIDHVAEDPNRSGISKAPSNEYYAAVKGLINIGKPAIHPCLKELAKKENNPEEMRFLPHTPDDYRLAHCRQENLLFVISRVLGNPETRSLLAKEIQQLEGIDPKGAENLRTAAKSPLISTP